MSTVRAELTRFLDARFRGAGIVRLAGDASTRSFFRVAPPVAQSVVIMDYGKPFEDETDDVRLERVFSKAGLPVARILESAPDPGCLVLEDLGDRSLESALLGAPSGWFSGPPALFLGAVDLAADVATRGTPVLADSDRARGPVLDSARFRFEMDFFLEHFAKGMRGLGMPSPHLVAALHDLADRAAQSPWPVLCHRDFHSRNLMIRPDGSLAMVDIQDARWGPDSYDLASLLRDAYVPIDDAWIEPAIERYLARVSPSPEAAGFRERFHVVATQRMLKALGSFGFLSGKGLPRYVAAIPPTLERLRLWLPGHQGTRHLYDLLAGAALLSG